MDNCKQHPDRPGVYQFYDKTYCRECVDDYNGLEDRSARERKQRLAEGFHSVGEQRAAKKADQSYLGYSRSTGESVTVEYKK